MANPIISSNPYPNFSTLTMFFKYKNSGWSEKYQMGPVDGAGTITLITDDLRTNAAVGCANRAYLLGLGVEITWARLTNSANPRQSVAVLSGPLAATALAAETPVEKINDVEAGLHFRLETPSGKVSNRILRGLRDTWVTDQDVVASLVPATPVALPTADYAAAEVGGSFTKANALLNFLVWIGRNCVNVQKQAPNSYEFATFKSALFRVVSDHQTGRPFGGHRGKARSQV